MTGLGRTFARNDLTRTPVLERFIGGLAAVMAQEGYEGTERRGPDTNVVLHVVDADAPKPYRRKARRRSSSRSPRSRDRRTTTSCCATGYPLLVRCLANLCVLVSDTPDGLAVRFVTLEQGTYGVGPGLGDDELFARRVRRIEPLASSRLVIANEFVADLPEHSVDGDDATAQMLARGPRLDALDLLPAPFPLEEILAAARPAAREAAVRHRRPLVRQRERALPGGDVTGVPDPDGPVFWMSASGVDKARPAHDRRAHPARPRLRPGARRDGAAGAAAT